MTAQPAASATATAERPPRRSRYTPADIYHGPHTTGEFITVPRNTLLDDPEAADYIHAVATTFYGKPHR